ncbi:MAG TPA: hemolysin family protein [Bacteroidales bacterium]
MLTEILIIIGLIFFNGLFAMAEIAMVSFRRTKLEHEAANGDKKASRALEMANKPGKFLSTVQIGMTLINIFTGVYSGASIASKVSVWLNQFQTLAPYSGTISITIVVITITFFTLIIGELVPKQVGLIRAESVARNFASPLRIFAFIMYPLIWLLSKPGEWIIKFLNIKPSEDSKVTEEEIKAIIKEGAEDGEIQEIEQDIVERVFHLGDRKAGSLMAHRSEMIYLNINDTEEQIKAKIMANLYNVYPVCDGNLDKILGIIYIKDLFTSILKKEKFDLLNYIKEPLFILESNTAYEILEKFRESKRHFGLVIDEYGSVIGLVTLNNLLLALVGEIPASDQQEEYEIVKRDDGSWLIDGQLPFYEFVQEFDIQYFDKSKIKFNTLGGFALSNLNRIPHTGEKFSWRNYEFEIVDMDGNRIDKILVTRL